MHKLEKQQLLDAWSSERVVILSNVLLGPIVLEWLNSVAHIAPRVIGMQILFRFPNLQNRKRVLLNLYQYTQDDKGIQVVILVAFKFSNASYGEWVKRIFLD